MDYGPIIMEISKIRTNVADRGFIADAGDIV